MKGPSGGRRQNVGTAGEGAEDGTPCTAARAVLIKAKAGHDEHYSHRSNRICHTHLRNLGVWKRQLLVVICYVYPRRFEVDREHLDEPELGAPTDLAIRRLSATA